MITHEQRAHDLTICLISKLIDNGYITQIEKDSSISGITLEYLHLYRRFLDCIEDEMKKG